MSEYASKGLAGTALGTGIGGLALGLMNGNGLGGILGGNGWNGNGCNTGAYMWGSCHENMPVNRYEAGQNARIAELETEVKLRDANIYTDGKLLELYKYFDGEIKDIRGTLCAQSVFNQRTEDNLKLEAERRCCADNSIVNYSNATFYPKMVADVTTGTTTTAQLLYNPIPDCGCCGNK